MGRPTGFLEIERRDRPYEKPEIAPAQLERVCQAAARPGDPQAGGALHGLRHPVLP